MWPFKSLSHKFATPTLPRTQLTRSEEIVKFAANVAIQVAQPQVCSPTLPRTQLTRSEEIVKFAANVAIQVAQPQVCYANPTQDTIDKK